VVGRAVVVPVGHLQTIFSILFCPVVVVMIEQTVIRVCHPSNLTQNQISPFLQAVEGRAHISRKEWYYSSLIECVIPIRKYLSSLVKPFTPVTVSSQGI